MSLQETRNQILHDVFIQAAESAQQVSTLFSAGKSDEAELTLKEVNELSQKITTVDALLGKFEDHYAALLYNLRKELEEAGFNNPNLEFLSNALHPVVEESVSHSERLDRSASPDQGGSTPPQPEIYHPKKAKTEKKLHTSDLNLHEDQILTALLAINPERSDYLYPNPEIREAATTAYADRIAQASTKKQVTVIVSGGYGYRNSGLLKLEKEFDNPTQEKITALKEHIASQPELANLNFKQLSRAIRRQVAFKELQTVTSYALTEPEVVVLADSIRRADTEKLGEMKVSTQDQSDVDAIYQGHVPNVNPDELQKAKETTIAKTTVFLGNKERVFVDNEKNPDALALFTYLANVSSRQTIIDLISK